MGCRLSASEFRREAGLSWNRRRVLATLGQEPKFLQGKWFKDLASQSPIAGVELYGDLG